jgi:hypothetical protein
VIGITENISINYGYTIELYVHVTLGAILLILSALQSIAYAHHRINNITFNNIKINDASAKRTLTYVVIASCTVYFYHNYY